MVRNLLGRLNSRSTDDLQRIAQWWRVSVQVGDRGNHIGTLYRAMTDLRQVRSIWERLDPNARAIVRDLATSESGPLAITDIARITELSEPNTREAAIRLFRAGILSREGDNQELPIGAVPKLFLPRELGQQFRRVQDEIDAGDLSNSSLRVLVETLDDTEIEEAARIWGLTVIPGFRRRPDLIGQLLRQVSNAARVAEVAGSRGRDAGSLWSVVRAAADDGPIRLEEAVARAGLGGDGENRRVLPALSELESALLVVHTYRRDGSRWLFVPREIVEPEDVAATLPLKPLQPLKEGSVPEPDPRHPYALAWDLLTVLREISEHDAPVWTPGEPLSRSWQRRINRRLWFAGEEVPPTGYLGFVLHLGFGVDVIRPAQSVGLERGALRPEVTPRVREWRRLSFAQQTDELKAVWLASDGWVEGRERGEIEVWGADWRGMRQKLVGALERIDPAQWVTLDDLAGRVAEQDPTLIGTTFTAASARSGASDADGRSAAIAQVIGVELETAAQWLRLVELSVVAGKARAVRTVAPPVAQEPPAGPTMTVGDEGSITLLTASPLHVWSLSAFSDAEGVRPEAVFQLRPGSVSRALAAGFDLDQILTYLTRQNGQPLPDRLVSTLREWSTGYRRVRLRRAVVLHPDAGEMRGGLRDVFLAAGLEVLGEADDEGPLTVLLPATHDGAHAERELLATLRANGYAGHWEIRATDG